ncbi:hypothetical protein GOODEAATRI_021125, partial [Goodea atripinnis]
CALAELVDNALSATAKNTGGRTIEIQLVGSLYACYSQHIYHYYIHGADGNHKTDNALRSNVIPQIDILVTLRDKPLYSMNLRKVEDDMQTLYINSAVDTFEFKVKTSEGGTVDGVLRYHPFLYDKETYPKDLNVLQGIQILCTL